MTIILGSASPRRREILHFFSLPFRQIPSAFDEESIPFAGDPRAYAATLSQKKGETLLKEYPNDLILTADTVVYCNQKIYNKPANREEAFRFLTELSGKWNSVFTAISLHKQDACATEIEETKILFHTLTPERIDAYLNSISYLDKAGGYAIQQGGGMIASRIDGCYYNVMGLPINALSKVLLKTAGIDLWHHLKH